MTCILALELAKGDDYVQVSGNAASQPQTRLGMREGQQFYLEDLLYSLMLKSHNDSAVAIAEHISGSVEAFAEKIWDVKTHILLHLMVWMEKMKAVSIIQQPGILP